MIASLVFLLAAQAGAAAADEVDCANAMTQYDMNYCAGREFAAADAELNRVWREVITSEAAEDRRYNREDREGGRQRDGEAQLRAAQRAWVTFRDGQCAYESYENFGGTMEPLVYNSCRAELTRQRTAQLSPAPDADDPTASDHPR